MLEKIKSFFTENSDELFHKVQWPTVPELQSSTVTVLIASFLIALIIWIMDFAFSKAMSFLYGIF